MSLWSPRTALLSAVLPYCSATCPQRLQPPLIASRDGRHLLLTAQRRPACHVAALRTIAVPGPPASLARGPPRNVILLAELTSSLACTLAPRSSSSSTVSVWPPAAAVISDVLPYCGAKCHQRSKPTLIAECDGRHFPLAARWHSACQVTVLIAIAACGPPASPARGPPPKRHPPRRAHPVCMVNSDAQVQQQFNHVSVAAFCRLLHHDGTCLRCQSPSTITGSLTACDGRRLPLADLRPPACHATVPTARRSSRPACCTRVWPAPEAAFSEPDSRGP